MARKQINPTQFKIGQEYSIMDYNTGRMFRLFIISRDGSFVTFRIGDIERKVKVGLVSQPQSESILIDGYSPVFSYKPIRGTTKVEQEDLED